ncbi:hypothetical protein ABMA28_006010 [Loxostege sticticalis]|uniref:Carboxylic ester hydrolase n=1 Tax=Loxostege sticticalis TaxID=481309 RepID=A0ABD0SJP8_LOXSC
MLFRAKWVVLWSLWAARLARLPTPPVRVSNGWLRGSVAPDGSYAQYLGIPYATVLNRFQAPGPEPTWDGVFEAVDENIRCRQPIYLEATSTSGQEDCLILNVYTPLNKPLDKPLPVMVFIHGGGYHQYSGSRMVFGPDYLVNKDIVLVTINYRLNIQGFLCLGIKEAPGNVGMKDQVAALKWVKKNMRVFGGDPDNVTIFGESAGGSSVSFHLLSPMSKGLFHKAITQSGSSLSAWAFQYNPVYLASLLAKKMGLDSQDPYELYKYFMNKSDTDLVVTRVPRKEGNVIISEILYTPCVEPIIEGEEPFLIELPYDLLLKGEFNKVPILIGSNSQEGILFTGMDEKIDKVVFEKALPKDLVFPSDQERRKVADRAKLLYMGEDEVSVKTKAKLSKLYGEPYFNYPVLEETELLMRSNDQPVYSYLFEYNGRRNILKNRQSSDLRDMPGATHADELFYLFRLDFVPSLFETDMIEKMTTMWTNFAKYGNPTPEVSELLPVKWPAVRPDDQRSFHIDKQLNTLPLWYNETLLFWKEVYSKYRRKKIVR